MYRKRVRIHDEIFRTRKRVHLFIGLSRSAYDLLGNRKPFQHFCQTIFQFGINIFLQLYKRRTRLLLLQFFFLCRLLFYTLFKWEIFSLRASRSVHYKALTSIWSKISAWLSFFSRHFIFPSRVAQLSYYKYLIRQK